MLLALAQYYSLNNFPPIIAELSVIYTSLHPLEYIYIDQPVVKYSNTYIKYILLLEKRFVQASLSPLSLAAIWYMNK